MKSLKLFFLSLGIVILGIYESFLISSSIYSFIAERNNDSSYMYSGFIWAGIFIITLVVGTPFFTSALFIYLKKANRKAVNIVISIFFAEIVLLVLYNIGYRFLNF